MGTASLVVAIVGALAAIAAVVYTRGQKKEAVRSANASERSAEAAEAAAKHAQAAVAEAKRSADADQAMAQVEIERRQDELAARQADEVSFYITKLGDIRYELQHTGTRRAHDVEVDTHGAAWGTFHPQFGDMEPGETRGLPIRREPDGPRYVTVNWASPHSDGGRSSARVPYESR